MRTKCILSTILLNILIINNVSSQVMPLVYDTENTGADCPQPPLPLFNELGTIGALPDPFEWSDRRGRISNFSDWRYRRSEIALEVQNYEVGMKPAPPENLSASYSAADSILTVTIIVNDDTLKLTAKITPPSGTGPFPAVIGVGFFGGTGSLPSDIFTSRGIATIQYNFSQVAPWTQEGRGRGGFYSLYPDSKIGYFTAWAWGVSRLIDGLQKAPQANIDLAHLAITGCSFAGKIALFSGALDERIALTIPQEPGGGGDAAWRVTETLSGSRETLRNAQSYGWYYQDLSLFNEAVTKLPYDHHELMAMIAPRALLVIGNPSMEWLADESGYAACKAAHEVWKALGVPERFGFSKVGHSDHCGLPESQRPEVEAFTEKFLLGNTSANTDIAIHPGYTTDLASWITWTTPVLSNDTSFFGRAALVFPSHQQTGADTNLTFRWNQVDDAEKYYIQVSMDPTFTDINKFDSTNTDTVKAISGLLKGKRYYWRIQAISSAGSGPWSDVWNFATAIPVPAIPQNVNSAPIPDRVSYYMLLWSKVVYADQYTYQLSYTEDFPYAFISGSTSDTSKTISGLMEGTKSYWRVKASNIAGSSDWSTVSNFTTILKAPTNLTLQNSGTNEITLAWSDNAVGESGYVIERKQSPQTSFTLLDTVKISGNSYVDKTVEHEQTYTYRIKAYTKYAESEYSNEASLLATDVDKEVMPKEYSISQNYPNPFNPATTIKYTVKQPSSDELRIYNSLGQVVKTLVNGFKASGEYSINWEGRNDLGNVVPSGIYFYRIIVGDFKSAKKMIYVK